jgi:nucleoside-diphosphate-sugar epimerase
MRDLISGCGYVGSALGLLLASADHEVFGLRRCPVNFPPGIMPVRADLSEPLPPHALPPDLDAAVYAVSPGEGTDDAYRLVYVDGPRNLLAALGESPSVRCLASFAEARRGSVGESSSTHSPPVCP